RSRVIAAVAVRLGRIRLAYFGGGASFDRRGSQSPAGRTLRRRSRRQDRLLFLRLYVADLMLDLRLEFVGSAAELIQRLAYLAGNLRQLLGPKDDEGQKEQEDRLGKTHGFHHTAGNGKAATHRRN